MTRYDAYKFVHITAAIVWLEAGVMIQLLAARAQRTRDDNYLHGCSTTLAYFPRPFSSRPR
jgi:uncharacterized membrane protein